MKFIKERRSTRQFKSTIPPRDVILKVVDAARHAPSATNFQPWKFLVITNPEVKEKMVGIVSDKLDELKKEKSTGKMLANMDIQTFGREYFLFFGKAPVIIAAIIKPYPDAAELGYKMSPEGKTKKLLLSVESTSAAVQNLLLAAYALGLGTCWLDGPLIAQKELEDSLCINKPWLLMCLIALGYPGQISSTPRKKKLNHIIKFID